MSEQQDSSENTMGDAHTPPSAPAINPAVNPAMRPAINRTMNPAMRPATDSATDPARDPNSSTSPASHHYASLASDEYASLASSGPVSPSSVLRARLHNQSPMRLGSQPLQPPDSPTPKAADRKRVFAESQRNRYAVRRAALTQPQLRQQEPSVNNENHRDQEATGTLERFMEIRERCEKVAPSKENKGTVFPNSKTMVEEFLKRSREPRDPPSDSDADMGGFI
ncbi:uncharacterized protein N7515_000579 [Penicillium bovifimosum]|uniref:Uncharacterized protein n=1 Tax=Penicillium bovifimosum TaxID=126998 RepID=A0A9W9HFN5_9EURO|nr:uncharacterized protein N7515_000579 [Penicillium bovifimosum]KAJ5146015.1 hypothetical protein N7515_000579 [Penicillium bovifimosum]